MSPATENSTQFSFVLMLRNALFNSNELSKTFFFTTFATAEATSMVNQCNNCIKRYYANVQAGAHWNSAARAAVTRGPPGGGVSPDSRPYWPGLALVSLFV